jgi:flagellar basal body-associated protein FliL
MKYGVFMVVVVVVMMMMMMIIIFWVLASLHGAKTENIAPNSELYSRGN